MQKLKKFDKFVAIERDSQKLLLNSAKMEIISIKNILIKMF